MSRLSEIRGERGSSVAEKNHSNVIELMYDSSENKACMEHAHIMTRDIFSDRKDTQMKQNNFYLVFKKELSTKKSLRKTMILLCIN